MKVLSLQYLALYLSAFLLSFSASSVLAGGHAHPDLAPPQDLNIVSDGTTLTITWNDAADAAGYRVLMSDSDDYSDPNKILLSADPMPDGAGTFFVPSQMSHQELISDLVNRKPDAETYYFWVTTLYHEGAHKHYYPTDMVAFNNLEGEGSPNGSVARFNFDEGSGSIITDSVGGFTGTLLGGASFMQGLSGTAMSFDGRAGTEDDRVEVNHSFDFDLPYSVSLWFNTNELGDEQKRWIKLFAQDERASGTGNREVSLLIPKDSSVLRAGGLNCGGNITGTTPIQKGQWYHATLTFDGSERRLYLDGSPEGPVLSGASCKPNTNLLIGNGSPPPLQDPFNGLIDDFRIYNRALNPAEILTIINEGGGSAPPMVEDPVPLADVFSCVDDFSGPVYTKDFDWASNGDCHSLEENGGCSTYDYRGPNLPNEIRFDQRGIEAYSVSFPVSSPIWGAMNFNEESVNEFICLAGGAHIGRNPLAMTWSGEAGGKPRKNNFLMTVNGKTFVEGVRVHNNHDPFYANQSVNGAYEFKHNWLSWIRDDFFEGYLYDIKIFDTLIDGAYTFLSTPDGGCVTGANSAGDKTFVIENSLIRLQSEPGPYGHEGWWVEGGHGGLYKFSNCSWEDIPKFELRNNVFLIEGPSETKFNLNNLSNNQLALPGDANVPGLANVSACENNLFLYTEYYRWNEAGAKVGEVPEPGDSFHNPSNPDFSVNGTDCYQRMNDDPTDPGYGDVMAEWSAHRQNWIDRHTGHSDPNDRVMRIAGVDYPAIDISQNYQMRNKATNLCVQSNADGSTTMASCNGNSDQIWTPEAFEDGKLIGALLMRNLSSGRGYLRSEDPFVMQNAGTESVYDPAVFWEYPSPNEPGFQERWYILPLGNEPGGEAGTYAIESDAVMRSFLYVNGGNLEVQSLYIGGENTPLPQAEFSSGNDPRLQWHLEPVSL